MQARKRQHRQLPVSLGYRDIGYGVMALT